MDTIPTFASTFAPICKTTEQDDGSLMVYGKATDDSLDLDDQRCDPTWLAEAMPAWFGTGTGVGGNIRAQHRPDSAVGKAVEHEAALDGHYITAKIVDRDAIAKTKAGVFTGFSIGIRRPKIIRSDKAANGIIAGGSITEISLVDRPANSNCVLTLCKAAKPGMSVKSGDFDSKHLLIRCEEFVELDKVPKLAPELVVKLDEPATVPLAESGALQPSTAGLAAGRAFAESLVSGASAVLKATDTGHLDAPAPGQQCADCGEAGHLNCGPIEAKFDKEKAKAVVEDVLAKSAGDGLGMDESGDISGAHQAIAIIAQLVISEAQDLASAPAQGCDIHLLMRAVEALRCFSAREQAEQAGVNPDASPIYLAAGVDALPYSMTDRGELLKAKYSAAELASMLKNGKAFKNASGDPSYPIGDKADLKNAIHAVGRGSGDHDAIRSYIKKRASALGASDLIPDNWTSSGSNTGSGKTAEPEMEKTVPVEASVLEGKPPEEIVEKTYTLNEARAELGLPPYDSEAADTFKVSEADVEKAKADAGTGDAEPVEPPETTKIVAVDDDSLVKAFSATMEKLEKTLANVEASTETTAKSVSSLTERLVKVEQMATPGGPALRQTQVERTQSRKSDLEREVARYKALSLSSEDPNLRRGYADIAAKRMAEAKALEIAS